MTAVLEWGDQALRTAFVQPITLRDPNIASHIIDSSTPSP